MYSLQDDIQRGILHHTKSMQEELVQQVEKLLETAAREHAVPPIKGEITEGKIKWRGLKICSQFNGLSTNTWIEQRGNRISEVVTFHIRPINNSVDEV